MPPFKRSSPKTRVVKKQLADGTIKEYRYDRRVAKVSKLAPDTIGALTIAFRQSSEWHGYAEATRRSYSVYLKDIERLQDQPVASITRRSLMDMRDAIAVKRGNGASTGFLRVVSSLFTWAVEREWIAHSPAFRVKFLPGGHLTAWTWQQAEFAMANLPEPYRRLVVLATYTGQRRGDLITLPWSAISQNQIRLTQQKTNVFLVLPIHPALRLELDEWRRTTSSTIILTSHHGIPWQPENLSHMLPIALKRIGLPPLGVHGLRKLAATRLAEAGASMHEIASVTGHKTLSMIQLYTASVDQERMASAAIARLPESKPKANRQTGIKNINNIKA